MLEKHDLPQVLLLQIQQIEHHSQLHQIPLSYLSEILQLFM